MEFDEMIKVADGDGPSDDRVSIQTTTFTGYHWQEVTIANPPTSKTKDYCLGG